MRIMGDVHYLEVTMLMQIKYGVIISNIGKNSSKVQPFLYGSHILHFRKNVRTPYLIKRELWFSCL